MTSATAEPERDARAERVDRANQRGRVDHDADEHGSSDQEARAYPTLYVGSTAGRRARRPPTRTPTIDKPAGPFVRGGVGLGHDAAREAQLRGLTNPQRRLGRRPDLAGQPDFAEHDHVRGDRHDCAGSTRRRRARPGRRPARSRSARRRRSTNTSSVARFRPTRLSSTASSSASRLGSRPFAVRRALPNVAVLTSACTSTRIGRDPSIAHSTTEPGTPVGRSARNSADGFGTARSPERRHLEDAELADGAKSVLHRAHDAVRVMLLALEIEHGVDDVLEHLRPGEAAVLGDVADEDRRQVPPLRGEEQVGRRLAHLRRRCPAPTASSGRRPSGSSRR